MTKRNPRNTTRILFFSFVLFLSLYGFCLRLDPFCVRNTRLESQRCCPNSAKGPWSIDCLRRSSVNDTHPPLSVGVALVLVSFLRCVETVRKFNYFEAIYIMLTTKILTCDFLAVIRDTDDSETNQRVTCTM